MLTICPCASASALRIRLGPKIVIYGTRFYVFGCIGMKNVHHVAPKLTKGELYTILSLVSPLQVFILVVFFMNFGRKIVLVLWYMDESML